MRMYSEGEIETHKLVWAMRQMVPGWNISDFANSLGLEDKKIEIWETPSGKPRNLQSQWPFLNAGEESSTGMRLQILLKFIDKTETVGDQKKAMR